LPRSRDPIRVYQCKASQPKTHSGNNDMATIELEVAKRLFARYRVERAGISDVAEMASVCLICGSPHIDPVPGEDGKFVCRNCGFGFSRYACTACDKAIDGRDPNCLKCAACGKRKCTCGSCACPDSCAAS